MGAGVALIFGLILLSVSLSVNANRAISEIELEEVKDRISNDLNEEEFESFKHYENLDDIKPEKSSAKIIKGIGKIIAFIVGAAILVIIVAIVCCCCCPFCLLAKRNNRGRVLREGPAQQPQNVGPVLQQGYALPPEQIQQMPPTQSYPPGGFNQPMPPSVLYPNQAAPQGYIMDQPPPYPGPPIQQNQTQQASGPFQQSDQTEYQKQPAFNPNAS